MRWLALIVFLSACDEKTRSTDTRSKSIAKASARVAFLCDYLMCPSTPEDAAFHVVYRDNSHGLVPGSDDAVIHAVVKVKAEDVARWSMGCERTRVEARPPWLDDVLAGTGWAPKTLPDTLRCGREERVVHVKEGLIIRSLVAN